MQLTTDSVHLLDGERIMLGALRGAWDGDHFKLPDSLRVGLLSLDRFDLVSNDGYSDGRYHWSLTQAGQELADTYFMPKSPCCPMAARLNCVCVEKTGCVLHGSKCRGSHD